VRPNTNGTVEGRLQRTRKIPLAKVGIPSAFRRPEDVNSVVQGYRYVSIASTVSKVVECVPHPTPKGEKERGEAGARLATLFLSLLLLPAAACLC